MSRLTRFGLCGALALAPCLSIGCSTVPPQALRQSQYRAAQLYHQNRTLAAERDQAHQMAQSLSAEKQQLADQNGQLQRQIASLQSSLSVANSRIENYNSERSELQQKLVSALNQLRNQPNPMSAETTRRFQELAKKYPDFEFDPQTGVSKFHSDILFDSGSAQIKTQGAPLLKEFADILNQGDAKRLNILVVGHTDDKPIGKPATRQQHPTNWHLSTNRANSVVLQLAKSGIGEKRMGVAGYSMYQPVVPNTDEKARQKNRRVEIFVLAPDAVVAGWDPGTSRE